MIPIDIIAVGRIKKGPLLDLWQDYAKRISWKVNLIELDDKPKHADKSISDHFKNSATIIALDEKGKDITSVELSQKISSWASANRTPIQFVIGGADGLPATIKDKADLLLSFGSQTWPHKLVRVMLLEQIYRAQTITDGHPYHRE